MVFIGWEISDGGAVVAHHDKKRVAEYAVVSAAITIGILQRATKCADFNVVVHDHVVMQRLPVVIASLASDETTKTADRWNPREMRRGRGVINKQRLVGVSDERRSDVARRALHDSGTGFEIG